MALHRSAFPDKHTEIQMIVADDDIVACHCPTRATHLGRYFNLEPTGNVVEIQEMMFNRVRDGKLAETRVIEHRPIGFYQQLTGKAAPKSLDNMG